MVVVLNAAQKRVAGNKCVGNRFAPKVVSGGFNVIPPRFGDGYSGFPRISRRGLANLNRIGDFNFFVHFCSSSFDGSIVAADRPRPGRDPGGQQTGSGGNSLSDLVKPFVQRPALGGVEFVLHLEVPDPVPQHVQRVLIVADDEHVEH